ncbi:hypothetical protein [Nonomuraea zeae]|uniref:Uncharacterized protein n=1 Tax=Nonomuraea zeae TaxID=1642303 RepID=A0A5S4GIM9_9ACTN|nr:hypothetical protein [Nonomuraea zeae]TMR32381.1 hypothetical protein ETD85_22975 [Nonomuraea zeae]
MTQDGALLFPPRPDGATTWDDYVTSMRTLRVWAGARDDAELAAAVPALTAQAIRGVLGEHRRAVPDRRTAELIVRACLLLRECSEPEIAKEQALWRAAWDRVLGAQTRPPRPQGRAAAIAAGVLLPAVTGVVINLASSNTRNPLAWGALGLLLVIHSSVLMVGTSRWSRLALPAGVASVVAVAVTAGLLFLPPPREEPQFACRKADPALYIRSPVRDPGLGTTWTEGYACQNTRAPVYAEPGAGGLQTGVLRQALNIFLCVVERDGQHWYRTAADEKRADSGWGYVSEQYILAAHPVDGLVTCPGRSG